MKEELTKDEFLDKVVEFIELYSVALKSPLESLVLLLDNDSKDLKNYPELRSSLLDKDSLFGLTNSLSKYVNMFFEEKVNDKVNDNVVYCLDENGEPIKMSRADYLQEQIVSSNDVDDVVLDLLKKGTDNISNNRRPPMYG